jgi:outer membrane protein OmpA-like peptidoglycan-associated protein
MKKLIFTTVLLVSMLFTTNAQSTSDNDFKPGWFIGLNGGVNAFFGEGNDFLSNDNSTVQLGDMIGYLGRFELGYKFSPVWGLRGMLGYNKYNWDINSFTKGFTGETLTLDALFNLSNLGGYNPNRLLDFSLFAGLGGAYQNDNVTEGSLAGLLRAGAQLDLNLSKSLALNLIAEANATTDNMNDFKTDLFFDAVPAVTLGLTYKFPAKAVEQPAEEAPVLETKPVEPAPAPVVEPAPAPVVEPAPVVKEEPVVIKVENLEQSVYFALNKSSIVNDEQEAALAAVAEYVKKNPTAKITVSGYADNATGTELYNKSLSQKRAETVAAKLAKKYGISKDNIEVKWFGSSVQVDPVLWKNRVVIIKNK